MLGLNLHRCKAASTDAKSARTRVCVCVLVPMELHSVMIIDDDSSRPLLIAAEDKDRRKTRERETTLMCF